MGYRTYVVAPQNILDPLRRPVPLEPAMRPRLHQEIDVEVILVEIHQSKSSEDMGAWSKGQLWRIGMCWDEEKLLVEAAWQDMDTFPPSRHTWAAEPGHRMVRALEVLDQGTCWGFVDSPGQVLAHDHPYSPRDQWGVMRNGCQVGVC